MRGPPRGQPAVARARGSRDDAAMTRPAPTVVRTRRATFVFLALAVSRFALGCSEDGPDASPPSASSGDERRTPDPTTEVPPSTEPTELEPPPSPNVPIPERLACAVDRDCVLTTFLDCCSHPACAEDAVAVSRSWLAEVEEPCSVVECSGSGERAPCMRDGNPPSAVGCVGGRCQVTAY